MRDERTVGHVSQVPLGEGRNFDVDGMLLTIFRTRTGEVFATEPWCPHRRGPLSDGLLGGTHLVCPLHDTTFDLRTGESLAGNCRLRTYPVRATEDGRIMLVAETTSAEVD